MHAPDARKSAWVRPNLDPGPAGKYVGFAIAALFPTDVKVDTEHRPHIRKAPDLLDIPRQRGQIAFKNVHTVPVAEIVRDLVAVEFRAYRGWLRAQKLDYIGVLGQLVDKRPAILAVRQAQ